MGRGQTLQPVYNLLQAIDDTADTYNVDFLIGYPTRITGGMRQECEAVVKAVSDFHKAGFRVPSVSVYQLWAADVISATSHGQIDPYTAPEAFESLWRLQNSLYDLGYEVGSATSFVRSQKDVHQWTVHRLTSFRHFGFGSGSYSILPDAFVHRPRDTAAYLQWTTAADFPSFDRAANSTYFLTAIDKEIRRVILGIRSGRFVMSRAALEFAAHDAAELRSVYQKVEILRSLGVLDEKDGTVALAKNYFLLTNAISAYLHPPEVPRKVALTR